MKLKEILETLKPVTDLKKVELYHGGENIGTIGQNRKTDLRIYAEILGFNDNVLGTGEASRGIALYAERAREAREKKGKYKFVDLLFQVVEESYELSGRIKYKE